MRAMEIAASLLLFAAATAQAGVQEQVPSSGAKWGAAVQVEASARILAGAEVRFLRGSGSAEITSRTVPQIRRDGANGLWIEFS